ncbi:MAG: sugar transferase [Planctomycetaceae bacterium]
MPHDFPSDAAIDTSQFQVQESWRNLARAGEDQLQTIFSYETAKRGLDLVVAIPVLVLIAPVLAVVALCIKLWDRGPIFFVQKRVGERGREFNCYKFRSMVPNAEKLKDALLCQNEHGDNRTFKMHCDPRITWIGRIIRKMSIDELPQLWNVVLGDMSLVGPRPPVPNEVNLYSESDRRRLLVRPGITCIWQVSGRGDLPFSEQVRLDLEYIENRNLLLDIKLLAMTIPAVLSGRGAY